MSKTKAGNWGGREVDMHLRAECTILRLRLVRTNRTFVSVGMEGIMIKSAGFRPIRLFNCTALN